MSQKPKHHNIPPSTTSIQHTQGQHYLLNTMSFPTEHRYSLRTSHNIALGAIITTWSELVCKGKSICHPSSKFIINFLKVIWALELALMEEWQAHTRVLFKDPTYGCQGQYHWQGKSHLPLPFWTINTIPIEEPSITDGSNSKMSLHSHHLIVLNEHIPPLPSINRKLVC